MTGPVTLPAGRGGRMVDVHPGPVVLAGALPASSLATHRRSWPRVAPPATPDALLRLVAQAGVRGRGGAGFPLARKIGTAVATGRTGSVVVNGAEGEPGSAKDSALMIAAPHLVLDGAEAVALALGVRHVQVVVPGERPPVEAAVVQALHQRQGTLTWTVTATTGGYVGGQSSAVLELLAGRANRPVTSWGPAAAGDRRRPGTLLSNAETFAQFAAALALGPPQTARYGTPDEPGTTVLTIGGDGIVATGTAAVGEVEHGTPLGDVLGPRRSAAVLVGGYHGTWLSWDDAAATPVSRLPGPRGPSVLGTGVVLTLPQGRCAVEATAEVASWLSGQRARQCGPCESGLPELARALRALAATGSRSGGRGEAVTGLASLVTGRGACAHPDGTARLAHSLVTALPDEVRAHERGTCLAARGEDGRGEATAAPPRRVSPAAARSGDPRHDTPEAPRRRVTPAATRTDDPRQDTPEAPRRRVPPPAVREGAAGAEGAAPGGDGRDAQGRPMRRDRSRVRVPA